MHCDTRELLINQELVERFGTIAALDENNALVEVDAIENRKEFLHLLVFGELDVVLLESLMREFLLIVYEDIL